MLLITTIVVIVNIWEKKKFKYFVTTQSNAKLESSKKLIKRILKITEKFTKTSSL